MIVRISGDRQYQVDQAVLEKLDALDAELEDAVQAADDERFHQQLARVLALVREAGSPVGLDQLCASDLILPPDDISLSEIAGELRTDGLIPGPA